MSFTGNVSATIGENLASSLGRKGTESDVTIYNNKTGDCVLSFVEPTSYPEKIQSLTSSLNISNQVLLKISQLTPELAEQIVTIDAAGIETGYLILAGDVTEDSINPLISDTVISSYTVIEEQVMQIREKLAELNPSTDGDAVVQVDHCFSVKGVGTVALGVVKQGIVKKYDELVCNPNDVKTVVKSIQVHDTDLPQALNGVRVGLCLKDIKPEDCPRGTLLTKEGILQSKTELELTATLSKFAPRNLAVDDTLLVNADLNYIPAKITQGEVQKGNTSKLTLELDKKIPLFSNRVLLLDPGLKMPRTLGYGKL